MKLEKKALGISLYLFIASFFQKDYGLIPII